MSKAILPVVAPIRYYDTEYKDSFPIANYYCKKFGYIPNYFTFENPFSLEICDVLKENMYAIIWTNKIYKQDTVVPDTYVYQKEDMLIEVSFKTTDNDGDSVNEYFDSVHNRSKDKKLFPSKVRLEVYYMHEASINQLIDLVNWYAIKKTNTPKISLVTNSHKGLTSVAQSIATVDDIDLEMHYGAEFVGIHNRIITKLSEEKGKGLVLLHGTPGTGKTSYIRYLCKHLNKEIIFLPPYLAENIASPDFVPFLLERTNSILIIEDAERIILNRESSESSRQGVSNILNMTDGILSDILSIQIIATFNTIREKIDKALLRKGRLIAEHKFDLLSVDSSNKLLRHLNKDYQTKVPMSLTDIYNIEEELLVVGETKSSIGFNNRY